MVVLGAAVALPSCVSSKKYNELLDKETKCEAKNNKLEKSNQECNTALTESQAKGRKLQSDLDNANTTIDTLRRNYLLTAADLAELRQAYEGMDKKYKGAVSGKDALQRELSRKEAELAAKEADLDEKEGELREKESLIKAQAEKLAGLQDVLDAQEKQMSELKERISQALLGFQDKGLTVTTQNGKVYVSMDEKLLFPSGSWTVNPEGCAAIGEIGRVMAANPDIHIMVEGHTDNVPLKGKGDVKDNWDLSVKRATSIVRILLQNPDVEPKNVSAAGRGEYFPLVDNDDAAGRAKNRRTEIILTPDLDRIYQLIDKK